MGDINHKRCPYIDCGSSDAFSFNPEKGVGKCHSCGEGYPKKGMRGDLHEWATTEYKLKDRSGKYVPKSDTSDDYWAEFDELMEEEYDMTEEKPSVQLAAQSTVDLSKLEVLKVPRRNIMTSTQDFYGVKVYGVDGEPIRETYPYPSGGIKTRHIVDKGFSVTGSINELFGMNLFAPSSSKMVTITEGEADAMSAYQMLKNGAYVNPVVSVPSATPSNKVWENSREWLDSFEKIILSVDNDKAGDALAEKISKMFLGKVYRVNHGIHKDANDFLQAGKGDEFKKAWWAAKKVKPDSILSDGEDLISLYDNTPDYEYCPTGIAELDAKMLGIHKAAFTLILAPTGVGKTEFVRYLEYQVLTKTDYSIGFCHLEETDLRSTLGLISYELQTNVTRKDLVDKAGLEAEVKAAMVKLTGEGRYNQFKMNADDGPDELVEKIRFLATVMGVDYIFFEPIQDIVSGNMNDKESKLTDLANTLKRLAPELNVGLIFIAHANEDGDAKYCKSLVQSAAYEIILSRDSNAETEEEANTTQVMVGRKNRVGGGSGYAGELTFSKETYMLTPKEPSVIKKPEAKQVKGEW